MIKKGQKIKPFELKNMEERRILVEFKNKIKQKINSIHTKINSINLLGIE